jgi:hypothetical protein
MIIAINFAVTHIGSGAPSSNDPKFQRRPTGAPWSIFHKSNDAKLFFISILKALESLETWNWFSWSKFNNKKNRGLWAILGDYQEDSY